MQKMAPPEVTQAFLEIVENQIRDNDPPETRLALERLQGLGHSRQEAIRLIACAVGNEIFHVMKHQEAFNHDRFVTNLGKLPKMPW